MNSASRKFIEQGSNCDESEPLNKLTASMRGRIMKRPKLRSILVAMAIGVSALMVIGVVFMVTTGPSEEVEARIYDVDGDFLVDGPNCKIPNLNPFAKEAMKIFRREKFEPCSKVKLLTSVETFDNDTARLVIRKSSQKDYLFWWQTDFTCCYQRIERSGENSTADNEFSLSQCNDVTNGFLKAEDEFILVTCTGYLKIIKWKLTKVIYRNAHAIIRSKESVNRKLEKSSKDKISVFLMGIDSISRLNLIRGMPNTYKHLEDEGWFEMRGFNKIGDNTFPNLMAMLTGLNDTVIRETCNWKKVGELEKCDFIWSAFNEAGYVTAYAEDEASINTFNYYETGFINEPTDYYFRPFALGAEENLEVKKSHGSIMCLGHKSYADHVYQYGLDFATKYKNEPSFGLFWTNSFSHEDLSQASSMDNKVRHYLNQLKVLGILDSSIVFFFSDHGMRFGPIRKHFIGWLEERLPFFYIWIPESFKKAHPDIVNNLKLNRDRLSSPYDFHITLNHILQISNERKDSEELSAVSCPDCQSLFKELPIERSCEDAGVSKHWCSCVDFKETDQKSKTVKTAVNRIINDLNADLVLHPKCAKLKLKEIHTARKSEHKSSVDYLISFDVEPSKAHLEGTVRCDDDECKSSHVMGSISRLNRYGNQSWCISDAKLRAYCYCK